AEHDRLWDARRDAAALLRPDPLLRQPRRELAEVAARRDLEGEPHARRAVAMLEHDRLLPDFRGEDGAVPLLGDEAQADDAGVIVELALEIGRGQRRVANSLDLQHGRLLVIRRSCARAPARSSRRSDRSWRASYRRASLGSRRPECRYRARR